MVIRIWETSLIAVNRKIKAYLGWAKSALADTMVLCRGLKQHKMHTFEGMVGYCLKDQDEPHFQKVVHNITSNDVNAGVELYSLYGADELKNRVFLTPTNIFDRALMYWKFKLRHPAGNDFLSTLHIMVKSGNYYPSSCWITPYQGRGMHLPKIKALWRCMIYPSIATYEDILNIFVNDDVYANTQSRVEWFNSPWQDMQRYAYDSSSRTVFVVEFLTMTRVFCSPPRTVVNDFDAEPTCHKRTGNRR
ncbi:hypothetical protein GOP47_0021236 [Adiantum capillus-veneris]|uniref:Uncharacterized protein n=1 Tax=Adiantum capillus-veneris TaxID=13818 RepID=A0A9D4UAR3_ADICA|nr:hypothetical protein GOP47_0021236 [Adiantum capillus-veneris]